MRLPLMTPAYCGDARKLSSDATVGQAGAVHSAKKQPKVLGRSPVRLRKSRYGRVV